VILVIRLNFKKVDPTKFDHIPSRLKFKHSLFSDDYVTPYFYHRYRWHPLLKLVKPADVCFGDFEVKNITYLLGDGYFFLPKEKWATVGDCLRHNQEVYKELKNHREYTKQCLLEKENKKKEAFKRANNQLK
jgi:hypothetical protein